jgi:hypothetical protein
MRIFLVWCCLPTLALAQSSGFAAVIPSPGSQANSPGATFTIGMTAAFVPAGAIIGPGTASATFAWRWQSITCGPGGFPACQIGGGSHAFSASVAGGAGQPFAVLYSNRPALPFPPPFASTLMLNLVTPFGRLHTPLTPTLVASGNAGVLVDGIGLGLNPAPALALPAGGSVAFAGTLQLGQGATSGNPDIAVQAIVADPTSAAGFSLTAAMTTAQHQ